MDSFMTRYDWYQTTVGEETFLLPSSVRRVHLGTYEYWRLCLRVDGVSYIKKHRIRASETLPLIEALTNLFFVIDTFGLPSRLHSQRKGKSDPNLPVGISGPHTVGKRMHFRVSTPGASMRSRGIRVCVINKDVANALEKARRLREKGVAAYQAATKVDAELVSAVIWQLIEELSTTE